VFVYLLQLMLDNSFHVVSCSIFVNLEVAGLERYVDQICWLWEVTHESRVFKGISITNIHAKDLCNKYMQVSNGTWLSTYLCSTTLNLLMRMLLLEQTGTFDQIFLHSTISVFFYLTCYFLDQSTTGLSTNIRDLRTHSSRFIVHVFRYFIKNPPMTPANRQTWLISGTVSELM